MDKLGYTDLLVHNLNGVFQKLNLHEIGATQWLKLKSHENYDWRWFSKRLNYSRYKFEIIEACLRYIRNINLMREARWCPRFWGMNMLKFLMFRGFILENNKRKNQTMLDCFEAALQNQVILRTDFVAPSLYRFTERWRNIWPTSVAFDSYFISE